MDTLDGSCGVGATREIVTAVTGSNKGTIFKGMDVLLADDGVEYITVLSEFSNLSSAGKVRYTICTLFTFDNSNFYTRISSHEVCFGDTNSYDTCKTIGVRFAEAPTPIQEMIYV